MGRFVVAKLKSSLEAVDVTLKDVSRHKEGLDFRIGTKLELFLNFGDVLQNAAEVRSTIQHWSANESASGSKTRMENRLA